PGYFTPRLARAVGPSGHVYAVDPEAAVLDVLRRRLGRIRVRNVTPVLSRDDDPLLPRGRCDVALLINAYHHMRGRTAFLRRLVASLPRSARVVNIDWNEETDFGPPPRRRVPRARFLRDARRAALRLVTAPSFLPHPDFLRRGRGRWKASSGAAATVEMRLRTTRPRSGMHGCSEGGSQRAARG